MDLGKEECFTLGVMHVSEQSIIILHTKASFPPVNGNIVSFALSTF